MIRLSARRRLVRAEPMAERGPAVRLGAMRRPPRLGPSLNWRLIVPVLAGAMLAVGTGQLVCALTAIVAGDGSTAAFGLPAAATLFVSAVGLRSARLLRWMPLRARDGFFAVTAAWVLAAAAGAMPFLLEGTFDRPVDAFFESMSGFTTTGATLLDDIEAEPPAVLLWRSISQWLGGVGIVVLVVAIAPATGLAAQRVFYAETSGVTAERLTPRIADTAKIIWAIYLTLTGLGFAAYLAAGMGPFDAVNHILTTLATGGYSTRTASIAAFDSLAVEVVAIVFMTLAGVNFAFYWRALRGGSRLWPQLAEIRLYLLIVAVATIAVSASLIVSGPDITPARALRDSAFTVVSLITTTGYTTADFDEFADFARLLVLVIMFVGACAGSTSGGMKVIRVLLLGKIAAQEVQRQLRPKVVQVLRVRGRNYAEEVRRAVLGFLLLYMIVFVAGTLAMAATGLDSLTATSSVVATLNVVGPGLGEVGGSENYGVVPDAGLWVLSLLMLIGRLEIFTVLVLFTPIFWRPHVA